MSRISFHKQLRLDLEDGSEVRLEAERRGAALDVTLDLDGVDPVRFDLTKEQDYEALRELFDFLWPVLEQARSGAIYDVRLPRNTARPDAGKVGVRHAVADLHELPTS